MGRKSVGTNWTAWLTRYQEKKTQERQHFPDDLARGLAVMHQVKRVRGRGVIRERNG
jgi:hypothetical protein